MAIKEIRKTGDGKYTIVDENEDTVDKGRLRAVLGEQVKAREQAKKMIAILDVNIAQLEAALGKEGGKDD